jgi:ComF family protein
MLRAFGDALLSVLLAPACAACRRPLDRPTGNAVCDTCWSRIAPVPPITGTNHTLITRAAAIGSYEGSLRDTIHALKYEGRRSVARPLGDMMRARAGDILTGVDLVVPVPLHWWRKYRRGFNQAEELAGFLGAPVARALMRTRATHTQTDLPQEARHANVRGAFAVKRGADVGGKIVVLVDDVTTTGATLEACAQALVRAGVREVRALTAARVAARRH